MKKNSMVLSFIFFSLIIVATIMYYERKLEEQSYKELKSDIKMQMLYLTLLESNISISNNLISSSSSYLVLLHKNNYNIEFVCEFLKNKNIKNMLFNDLDKFGYHKIKTVLSECNYEK